MIISNTWEGAWTLWTIPISMPPLLQYLNASCETRDCFEFCLHPPWIWPGVFVSPSSCQYPQSMFWPYTDPMSQILPLIGVGCLNLHLFRTCQKAGLQIFPLENSASTRGRSRHPEKCSAQKIRRGNSLLWRLCSNSCFSKSQKHYV